MPRLFLLDHSLQNVGGHHFDYAMQSLRAADAAGFEIVLAAHRRFDELTSVPKHWQAVAPFRHTMYGKHTIHVSSRSGRGAARKKLADRLLFWLNPVKSAWRRADRNRRIRQFAAACESVFAQFPAVDGDIVFVPTLSEFDLLGLVLFLQSHPQTTKASWHLQFHFNVFEGREPDYAEQTERADLVRRLMSEPLSRIPNHQVHLYATCDPLARQFNLLDMGEFQSLSYPVDPAITVDEGRRGEWPLRLTCAGAIREEKGQQQLSDLVAALGDDYFFAGKTKLVVQSNKSWFRLEDENGANDNVTKAVQPSDIIEYVGHPLSPTEYAAFIRQADVGLLLYDSRRYYARRAGVMGEYLAAGTPVVVPAGCWLSEQLAEANFQYLDKVVESGKVQSLLPSPETIEAGPHLETTHADDRVERPDTPQEVSHQCGEADNLVIRFRWTGDCKPGEYVRLRLNQRDEADNLLRTSEAICGQRAENRRVSVLFRMDRLTRSITLSWSNAYHQEPLTLTDVELFQLRSGNDKPLPLGVVGVAFASAKEVPAAVSEVVDHFDHYRQSAIEFSDSWAEQHSPSRTIAQLMSNAKRA